MGDLGIQDDEGLREFVLTSPGPAFERSPESQAIAEPTRARVIGPGRLERGYLERLERLANELEQRREIERRLSANLAERQAALEMSQRVEHGCQRHIDRLEGRLEERTQALLESERQHKRLILALGAMARENEMLRAHMPKLLASAASGELPRAGGDRSSEREPRPRAGLWRRIFGAGR